MDIAKEAAELFSPPPWEHKVPHDICVKCWSQSIKDPCPIPDPIDITDFGLAIKTFRELDESFQWCHGVYNIVQNQFKHWLNEKDFYKWIAKEATAEQIFEICVLAKQAERKS